jgi:hypothetical protein
MNITYRTARKEDCPRLADFIYISPDGVVEFLFRIQNSGDPGSAKL